MDDLTYAWALWGVFSVATVVYLLSVISLFLGG